MVTLYDHRSRPIKKNEITEEQTSHLAHLFREFDEHPSLGVTPRKLASIMRDAEQGNLRRQAELMMDMEEKDGHIFSELSKRKRALLTLDWDIVPPANATSNEQAAAETAKEIIESYLNIEDVILDMADAIGHAYSNTEFHWQEHNGHFIPVEFEHRPPSWFTVHPDNRNELRLRDNTQNGAELRPFNWISHIHKSRSGVLARTGLVRVLCWPFVFKNYSVRDLAEFLEIYGLPLRLGKYPSGANKDEKRKLLNAVVNIGHNAAGIIPEGMMIEFQEAAKGSEKPFATMHDIMERIQSKVILGGTLTSQADGKSSTNALGNVHNEVRQELTESDARQIARTITRDLIYPICLLNGLVSHRLSCPRFEFDTTEPEDLKLLSEAVPVFVDLGAKIPTSWLHDKTKIPQANDDEEILQRATPGLPVTPLKRAALKTETKTEDVTDAYLSQLHQLMEPLMNALIEDVKTIIHETDDLDEAAVKLLELYPDQNPDAIVSVLQRAMAASHAAGQYEVDQGE